MCGEPGDRAVLAQQPVSDGRHPSVDDDVVCRRRRRIAAVAGEVGRRDVGEAGVRRRRVVAESLLPQSPSLDERHRRIHRSLLTQPPTAADACT